MSDKKGLFGAMSKMSPKTELLGGMEQEALGVLVGDISKKILPFVEPMVSGIGEMLGNDDYIAVIRNGKDKKPNIIVIENKYIKTFDINKGGVVFGMDVLEFIMLALNPESGIEEFFKSKIEELKKERSKL